MKSRRFILLLALTFASLSACSNTKDGPKASAEASSRPAKAHAATSVVPGSYDDWCDEHGVPESKCTRCNPKLIPAFKAMDDWCEEHQMPESQCTACNPNLEIVRPPKP
ncbi:MAG: hypothetical protein U0271_39315 [Polyangiaceae bacterium]